MSNRSTSNVAPKPEKNPPHDSYWMGLRISRKSAFIVWILLLVALAVGVVVGRKTMPPSYANVETPKGSIRAHSGPWGELEYLPITITAPEELLKVRGLEETPVRWYFKGYSRNDLVRLFDNLDLRGGTRERLLQAVRLSNEGVVLEPSPEAVLDLAPSAIEGIYQILGLSLENNESRWEFLENNLETFRGLGVSEATVSRLRKLSAPSGKFLVCYSMPYVIAGVPDYAEKVNLAKALTQQQTLLMKLRITPETDINALVAYWGKAFWTTDVKSILESIKRLPNGGLMDVIELLPPVPTSHLYTYPVPQSGLTGTPVNQNCSWTAFNFFRDPPDSGYSNPNYVLKKLKEAYYPIQSDPRYGDVLVFLTPDRLLLHTAVFVADNIVYTKNGDNPWHPWIFSRVSDLEETFSATVPAGQKLSMLYFRNKYY